jgi:beta-lactam-binding protein with PASTA domain
VKLLILALALALLFVSGCSGPGDDLAQLTVPPVVGMSLNEARGELSAAGFRVGEVTPKRAAWNGIVSSQYPTAGSLMRKRARIDLIVEDGR